jgi:hypothetical protein
VTFSTKATIACFGAVSFHEGSGSAARALVRVNAKAPRSAAVRHVLVFIVIVLMIVSFAF